MRKITVADLVNMCTKNKVPLNTPIVISDVDEWNKPICYDFDCKFCDYTNDSSEIVIRVKTDIYSDD